MANKTSTAWYGEECNNCGYPFDEGDRLWRNDEDDTIVFCGMTCCREYRGGQV